MDRDLIKSLYGLDKLLRVIAYVLHVVYGRGIAYLSQYHGIYTKRYGT